MSLHLSSTEGLRNLLKEALRISSSKGTDCVEAWQEYCGSSDGDLIPYSVIRAAILAVSAQASKLDKIGVISGTSTRNTSEISSVKSKGGSASVLGWLEGCEVILPGPPPRVKVRV